MKNMKIDANIRTLNLSNSIGLKQNPETMRLH